MSDHRFLTSESVTEGHPDKICDQISDAVLDSIIEDDLSARVACETFVSVGLVLVGGEITTTTYVDINQLARDVIKRIGYTDPKYGFYYGTCAVLNVIGNQSPDIAQGVETGGAGDQGSMIGYATNETPEMMPMPIIFAHKLARRLAIVRKQEIVPWLGPDGKSQVTVEYVDGVPRRIEALVISTQHTEEVVDSSGKYMLEEAKEEIKEKVIKEVIPGDLIDRGTKVYVNPTGKFLIGGPQSDTGMTGRKIVVDTYGGVAPHGGGAFSGKDPTKVDRSASYMARYVAKNIVAAGLASKCEVDLSYAIGVTEPLAVNLNTFGTGVIPDEEILKRVNRLFSFTPRAMIEKLNLLRPIYQRTACYGHFGREEDGFTWEKRDMVDALKER